MFLGLTGLVRWDFALLGVAACGLPFLLSPAVRRLRNWLALILPLLLLMGAGFAPFVVLGDVQRWVNEIPLFHLYEFPKWRSRDANMPAVRDLANAANAGRITLFVPAAELFTLLAPLALAALALPLAAYRIYWRRESSLKNQLALLLALLTWVLLNQVRVRSGLPQGLPAAVVSLPLAPYVIDAVAFGHLRKLVRPIALGCAVCLAIPAVLVWSRTIWASEPLDMPRASYLRVLSKDQAAWKNYRELVAVIRRCTREDEPLFSGVADTSRLFVNDSMLYFLANRPSATRWFEMEPGLTGAAWGQAEVVRELADAGVSNIVLWNTVSIEPNATAVSTGIHTLDQAIAERYPRATDFDPYVLRSVSGPAGDACQSRRR
jgi:hypothetical protein